jgi:hypothetical protein
MTSNGRRIVSVLIVVAVIFSAIFLPGSASAETLRFVFLADSRSDTPTAPDPPLTDLINTAALNGINAHILALSPRPKFVVFGGDMSYRGCWKGTYTFQTWKNVMSPITDAGIKLYTAIGNHELYDKDAPGFLLANQQQYQQAFTDNPGNGPAGYERLVYSFESPGGDCFFAVLDPYFLTADVPNPNTGGTFDTTQLMWLASQVGQTKATHKFLFNHAPYYYVKKDDIPTPADTTYTYLWSFLDDTGFNIYFCGHTHLYSRKAIDKSIAPDPQTNPPLGPWQNNVVQLLNGTCGAPVDSAALSVDAAKWHVSQAANTYYFSVVDINADQVTVTSYGYNEDTAAYGVIDSFVINPIITPAMDLLLQ